MWRSTCLLPELHSCASVSGRQHSVLCAQFLYEPFPVESSLADQVRAPPQAVVEDSFVQTLPARAKSAVRLVRLGCKGFLALFRP